MEFRWLVVLTLWTFLIGPVVDHRTGDTSTRSAASVTKSAKKLDKS